MVQSALSAKLRNVPFPSLAESTARLLWRRGLCATNGLGLSAGRAASEATWWRRPYGQGQGRGALPHTLPPLKRWTKLFARLWVLLGDSPLPRAVRPVLLPPLSTTRQRRDSSAPALILSSTALLSHPTALRSHPNASWSPAHTPSPPWPASLPARPALPYPGLWPPASPRAGGTSPPG